MSTKGFGTGQWRSVKKHLNFYRVHSLFFTFTPLIFSGIFYASNGQNHISYIDSLFNCVSAMTVCGLATVDLSSLTPWQQAILFIQMCLGTPVLVSWVMVYIRKYYFEKKFEYIIKAAATPRGPSPDGTDSITNQDQSNNTFWARRIFGVINSNKSRKDGKHDSIPDEQKQHQQESPKFKSEKEKHAHGNGGGFAKRVRTDMIRRMDDAPKLVNPSGWISEGDRIPMKRFGTMQSTHQTQDRRLSFATPTMVESRSAPSVRRMSVARRLSDPGSPPKTPADAVPMHRFETVSPQSRSPPVSPTYPYAQSPPSNMPTSPTLPRTQTVEFSLPRRRPTRVAPINQQATQEEGLEPERPAPEPIQPDDRRSIYRSSSQHAPPPFMSYPTNHTYSTYIPGPGPKPRKHSGFGGFPMPHEIIRSIIKKFFPTFGRKLTRTVTIPRTMTITSHHGSSGAGLAPGTRAVPYVSFETVVGRNSAFPMLSEDQLEELGGVEYRALNALLWIVAGYHILAQLIPFVIIAPYISQSKWHDAFTPPALHRKVNPVWFALFQTVSSYTNTGTSLVDTSMLPFQNAYVMILLMIFLILAGNTAFPIFLRFTIWILTKLVPKTSRANETLHFLLDHPRRCFIYLFPSHQTWFLLTIVIGLTFTDWFFFMVLDIGTPAIEAIPLGTRFVIGLLQGVAVRAAGFGIVPLAALAPAVKVLYVVMMYISVYPIAMSVRSTNVYEEQSLGIYGPQENDEEGSFSAAGHGHSRVTVWSSYLAMHARRQLAFDMWWLCLALFLVCIIERSNLEDPNSATWFNVFNIIFELVSAYGTVGLEFGHSYRMDSSFYGYALHTLKDPKQANFSMSGSFRPLSKLIVCVVMLRGRHRGLPVAIDRAVMLPQEFHKNDDNANDDTASQFYARSTGRQSILMHNYSISNGYPRGEPSIVEEDRDPVR
ncbi:hypothetical protein AAF712_000230 [Marasmius tenuissimus]|uniref:Potassium transport protein n=1 Tax=Marasmius tenuissimus TaxID=585030 RepID=A0ABR3AEW6_9AGAR